MNRKKALDMLINYLNEYMNAGFCFHIEFIEEVKNLLVDHATGHEKEVFHLLVKQLGFVKTFGVRVNEADHNEKLKNTGEEKDYYSLHIQNGVVNIRLLMAFSEENVPIFLAAFFEKSGKRATDYSQWMPTIKKRYGQIIGE